MNENEQNPKPFHTGPEIGQASEEASDREGPKVVSRRWMLLKAGMALNGLVGIIVGVPIIRYLLAPVRRDDSYKSWVSLGPATDFPVGETRLVTYRNPWHSAWDGATDDIPCYVRREGNAQFKVFAINCAHLGCPVRWFPQSQLFMCPCHGGVYYADGSRASGPPERGLFTYDYKLVAGNLRIDAGQMPSLANTAKLVQIATPGNQDGGCSCQG